MNPRELREFIEIQDFVTIIDDNGFELEDYKTIAKLRAKVKTQGTKEFMEADKSTTKLTIHVICRVRKSIDADKFLLYNSKRWNIRHVHFMVDRKFMTLTCEVID